jgi:naphthalene 1,2-dioxygenase system ferredoxin subunit
MGPAPEDESRNRGETSVGEEWAAAGTASKLAPGEMLAVTIGDREIALYNISGTFRATDNLCTHAFAYLTDGWLEGDIVECPLHGGKFEVLTGKGLGSPISCDIVVYEVRVVDDEIQVKLPPKA